MRSHDIHFTDLLRGVLPLDHLPAELRKRVDEALASGDRGAAEAVALEAIRALEGRGVLRVEKTAGERVRRYRNLITGATISIHLPEEPRGTIASVPLPVMPGGAPASLETTRELLLLASHILTEDGSRVIEREPIIKLLVSFARHTLACEEARYLSLERDPDDAFTHVSDSDSPFADLLADEWGSARPRILAIGDREPEEGAPVHRSGAAIPVGRPGDRIRGAIEVWSSRPGHFTRERLAILELIADVGRELLANVTRLQELVFIDSRTQIFNKAFFEIQFANLLARARREGRQMALAIIDVDDFKGFNSRYGYAGGDQVLARVAQTLKNQVRPFDCVARWGGEEFTIVLAPPVEHDDAFAICERLRRAVQQTTVPVTGLDGKEHRASVTVSVGGALFPDDGNSAEELWKRANESLLNAKDHGKNRVHFRPHDRRDLRVAPA